jgi:hypothetical protein
VADHTLAYLRRLDEKLDALRAELRGDLAEIREDITVLTGAFMRHHAGREARLARLEERAAAAGADRDP